MNLSVVIPAYNERENIGTTIDEILSVVDQLDSISGAEIIVVDDHSSDGTFHVIENLNKKEVRCVRLSKRSGSHTAIRAGLTEAKGDAILCISADGQDDPHALGAMIKKWDNGAKIVWALRTNRNSEQWHYRKLANSFYRILRWLGGGGIGNIDQSRADFFLFDKGVVKAINGCSERNTHLFGLIDWIGFTQETVEYERRLRRSGKAKWSYVERFYVGTQWIMSFSGLPLRLMSIIGTLFATVGLVYALYVIVNVYTGHPAPGWSSIMVAILTVGGLQMIMLGIVGEYLWRNLEESRNRPLWFFEERTDRKG